MSTQVALTVTPEEGVTDAYAAASGDGNPIHVDEAFAQSVGLPGRILHGLWTAAQVARAAETVAVDGLVLDPVGPGARYALASLELQFRGMGRIGPEIEISASTSETEDGTVAVRLDAVQDGTRLIRNARACVRVVSTPS